MPTIDIQVERAGLAEQFVQNLQGTVPDMLTRLAEEITNDIAIEAPPHTTGNPKAGDVPLGESFTATPAQQVEPGVWEAGIESSVPAKARALEYGSGLHGPAMAKYPIYPRNARYLSFMKEGKRLILPMVMHPGVYAHHYINTVLRRWQPLLIQRFGEAIKLAAVHHWGTY